MGENAEEGQGQNSEQPSLKKAKGTSARAGESLVREGGDRIPTSNSREEGLKRQMWPVMLAAAKWSRETRREKDR